MNLADSLPPDQKRKLLAQLERKLERGPLEREIAIVGLAGRYPQARDMFHFWNRLKSGSVCTGEVPPERWDGRSLYDPDPRRALEGKYYCNWGGFLDGISRFDAGFFHVSPREAGLMDPQERLFLEVAWQALEDAGYARNLHQPRQTGVFLGVTTTGYPWVLAESRDPQARMFQHGSFASLANRVSFFFNFRGPSMPVDTMCSSSLTAVVLACESILRGECDSALAGGVNLYPHPSKYVCLSQMGLASLDGQTRSFGQGGKGFVPGEGVGAVFLKPLLQALKDGDSIYATILGGAVNHTGKSSVFLAPNPEAQAALAVRALEKARVSPRSISYVEAQGLGSELVDAVEIAGLTRAYRQFTQDRQFCSLGSLKPNLGHAEAASGIAQLTKVLLQLKWKALCPTLIDGPLNPQIPFADSPFYLQRDLAPWARPWVEESGANPECPRRAAVCAHGAGGSSAHLIVEEFENPVVPAPAGAPAPSVFPFSARTRASLNQSLVRHLEFIEEPGETGRQDDEFLRNMAFTLQTRREPMSERIAFVADSLAGLAREIRGGVKAGAKSFSENGKPVEPSQRDPALSRVLESASAWARGHPLPAEIIISADQGRPVSLPPYCFESTSFWVGGGPETNAVPAKAAAPKVATLGLELGPRRQFFDSLQSYYRCQVLDWFQQAGFFAPGSGATFGQILGRLRSPEKHRAWLLWLIAWLQEGGMVRRSKDELQLTEWAGSAEVHGQIRGLASRRGLILRAIPEIEPHLNLLDHTGDAFQTLLKQGHGQPDATQEAPPPSVFEGAHRFAKQLEIQVHQCLGGHFSADALRARGPVRVLETGLGSFAPLRASLGFFCRAGNEIDLVCADPGPRLSPLQEQLIQAVSPAIRFQTHQSLAPIPGDGFGRFDLILVHRRPRGDPDAPAPAVESEWEAWLKPVGLVLEVNDWEMDYFSLTLGRLDERWLGTRPLEEGCPTARDGFALEKVNSNGTGPHPFPQPARERVGMDPPAAGSIQSLVTAAVAGVLGARAEDIDAQASFQDQALGSIMLSQLYLELKSSLGDWVTPQLLLGADSVAKLADSLSRAAPATGLVQGRSAPEAFLEPGDPVLPARTSNPGSNGGGTPAARPAEARRFQAPRGWEIEFHVEGKEAATPVVFLTALAFTKGVWELQARELGGEHCLIFPHLPGHAGSGASRAGFTFDSLADDLAALLDSLNLAKVHLVGWCMAGNIGQIFALRHPSRLHSLTLVCTTPTDARLRGLSAGDLRAYAQSPLYTYETEFENLAQAGWMSEPSKAGLLDRARRHFCRVDPGCVLHYIENLFQFDTRGRLPGLATPTLVMAGQWDIAFPAAQVRLLHEGIPGSSYHHFKKSGHMPFLTQPDLFNYLLEVFIQSVHRPRHVADATISLPRADARLLASLPGPRGGTG